ncbi:MAG TPA: transglycosylase SLT domain-containing protein, partial [Phenylobacterium sp.]|nr:transglycosylase SLT domain-containing protein [Phenylobacterium sp.]
MTVQGLRGAVETAIQRASSATGVDFTFLMRTAHRESGYNPQAKARTSSAAGLFQFVEQTWLATLKQHGAKYGYARYAELIERGSDGRYRVPGAEARKTVMDLRFDPHAASLMAGELATDHAAYLRGRVGRQPTAGELYAAHFLGPQGSARLIEAVRTQPGASAAALFPDAARANRPIFYKDGRAATVAEVYANLTRTGGAGAARGPPGGAAPGHGLPPYAPTPP